MVFSLSVGFNELSLMECVVFTGIVVKVKMRVFQFVNSMLQIKLYMTRLLLPVCYCHYIILELQAVICRR